MTARWWGRVALITILAASAWPAPPLAGPPMPEVIRPSGGDSTEGQRQPTAGAMPLPGVIRPSEPSGPPGRSGTGFFVTRDGGVLTVAHLVRDCEGVFLESRHLPQTTATVLAMDPVNDIAVLKVNETSPPAVLVLTDLPFGQQSLGIYGFPPDGDALTPTRIAGWIRTDHPTFDGLERLDRPDMLWVDANTLRPGFSGGPVLDPKGDAVGLVNGQVMRHTAVGGTVMRDTKFVFGASARTIAAFLRRDAPTLVLDAERGPPPEEADKAIVRVTCTR